MKKELEKTKNAKWALPVAVMVLLIMYFVKSKNLTKESKDLKTEVAQYKSISEIVSASGNVISQKDVKVSFGTAGKISSVNVKKGDKVKKGQILASLDTTTLYNNLVSAEQNYRAALGAKDLAVESRKEWLEINQYQKFNDVLRAQRAQNDASVRHYSASAEAAKAQVEVAKDALSKANLISPIDGTVLEVNNMEAGGNIASTSLTTSYIWIAESADYKFLANVDEVDLENIKIDQKVEITLDAYKDKIFDGKVSYIYNFAQRTGVGSMVIPVEIDFVNPDKDIKIGLSGDADFIVQQKEKALVVPKAAVRNGGEKARVFVLTDLGNVEEREVKVGIKNTKYVEITKGLKEGEKVVISKLKNEK